MKYENARDVLPPEVLALVQRHAAGKLIYVPQTRERLAWGERSGWRYELDRRNAAIRRSFAAGATADDLANEYFLTPETIKKIVYSRKEKNTVDLNEIFKIYSDEAPDSYEVIFDDEWEEGDREAGLAVEIIANFGNRTLSIIVSDYVYVTHERVSDFERRAKAYDSAGIPCARIARTRSGGLWKDMVFRDHTCIVLAWEVPEGYAINTAVNANDGPFGEDGRFEWHDDMIVKLAAVASARIETETENCLELFNSNSSCFGRYEDWNAEEFFETLKRFREAYPELSNKVDAIESAANALRDVIRSIYPKLPRSTFPGRWWGYCTGIKDDAPEVAFLSFIDGGEMASAAHIVCECTFTIEYLPDNHTIAELTDPDVRRRRIAAREHDVRLFAEHYPLNADERAAIPLLYRLVCVRDFAWYMAEAIIAAGEETTAAALDELYCRLTTDELDFESILC